MAADLQNKPVKKKLMRSLGEFFGHIWQGATREIDGPDGADARRVVTRQSSESTTCDCGEGPVTLRRTIIEEIELPSPKESQGS